MKTDEKLNAIALRVDKAGPGPWEWETSEHGVIFKTQHLLSYRREFVARLVAGRAAVVDLLANAWGDLAYLLGRVRQLEARVEDLQARLDRPTARGMDKIEQAEQLRAALDTAMDALTATTRRTTGYDWNADPDSVTLLQGQAFDAYRATLEGKRDA